MLHCPSLLTVNHTFHNNNFDLNTLFTMHTNTNIQIVQFHLGKNFHVFVLWMNKISLFFKRWILKRRIFWCGFWRDGRIHCWVGCCWPERRCTRGFGGGCTLGGRKGKSKSIFAIWKRAVILISHCEIVSLFKIL